MKRSPSFVVVFKISEAEMKFSAMTVDVQTITKNGWHRRLSSRGKIAKEDFSKKKKKNCLNLTCVP